MRRLLLVSVVLVPSLLELGCRTAASEREAASGQATSGQATNGQATNRQGASPAPRGSGGLQFVDVNDPVYGVTMGKTAFFPGWHGTASVTRNDPFCADCNTVSVTMTSPDGRSQIQSFDEGLHTGPYPSPSPRGHFVRTRFSSTGDLIVQDILPGLGLHGQVSAPRPSLGRQAAAGLEEMKRIPVATSPFAQGAAVTITGNGDGKDYVVDALTQGNALGQPSEFTVTHFTVIQAPAGQADALARRWEALAPMTINPEWHRRNDAHVMATLERMQQQNQQQSAQVQQWMRSYNATQAAFNQSQLDSNAAARARQQGRADQSLSDAEQNRRGITDTGNLVNDSRNGNSRYYTFCNNVTGQVAYQYNNIAPPDASGHWLRCGD